MKNLNKKKILITGGLGFIGFELAKNLSKKYSVTIVDKKKYHKKIKNITIISGDLSKELVYKKLDKSYQIIFHLAAQTSTKISEENILKDYQDNILVTQKLTNFAKRNAPEQIIFASSMVVYGKLSKNVKELEKTFPQTNYAKNKIKCEKMLLNLKSKKTNVIIARLFNVYGPGQDFYNMNQGMISIYVSQAIIYKKIKITGSLNRYRDFIYIDDLIKAFSYLIKYQSSDIFNVGSGKKNTVKKVITIIDDLLNLGKDSVKIIKSQKKDVFGSYANIDKIKHLGWKPKIKLRDGLKKTILNAKSVLLK